MDKSCQSSGDSSSITTGNTNSNSSSHQYLKSLNKLSHKISKPTIIPASKKPPPFDPHLFNSNTTNNFHQPQQPPPPPQQHQPPVYNINKNDFRDVVQKLTGSPAHERFSTPPPIHPPKPPSSRLHRIRPPPLAHVSSRPPPLVNSAVAPPSAKLAAPAASNTFLHRPPAPLSPLPPFPAVHAAAESPVSAYMRYLQNSISNADSIKQFSGFPPLAPLVSPRWNSQAPLQQNQQPIAPPQQGMLPSPTACMMTSQPQFQSPPSPLPFGCFNSPRSPHPFFPPGLLLSPSSFPVSPTLPVPSPKWRSL